jgi:hypothetical protein
VSVARVGQLWGCVLVCFTQGLTCFKDPVLVQLRESWTAGGKCAGLLYTGLTYFNDLVSVRVMGELGVGGCHALMSVF